MPEPDGKSALGGVKILDMTRVLAGPSATQMLGDLGANVVKVERPGIGDDTRGWGPPYLKDAAGQETTESAYYLSANRNKRSLTLDYTSPEGRRIARALAAEADVLVENYKPGTLGRHGLGYDQLKPACPALVYCSITGFGLTGPYADRPGYDFLIQAMGGIMSVTGEPDSEPMKVGVAIADLMAGMYATVAILAALRHRDTTGDGQQIDLSLLDAQVAWLSNAGQYFLTSGEPTPRLGNAHPMIVPYQAFAASDGFFILAVGNDAQFTRFCDTAGRPDLASDDRFATNRGAGAQPDRTDRDARRDHLPAILCRLAGRSGGPQRPLRPDQRDQPSLRRPAGAVPRHEDRHGPPARPGADRPHRQPLQDVGDPGRLSPPAANIGPAYRRGARGLAGSVGRRDRRAQGCRRDLAHCPLTRNRHRPAPPPGHP